MQLARYVPLQTQGQLDWLEVARLPLLKHFVDVLPGHLSEFFRNLELNPGSGLQFWCAVATEVFSLRAHGIAHHLPAVAGQVCAMNNQRADSAVPRGLFKFVGPAAIVSERFAFEEFGIVGDWFVH